VIWSWPPILDRQAQVMAACNQGAVDQGLQRLHPQSASLRGRSASVGTATLLVAADGAAGRPS
jgi:hypothetical protein